MSRAEKAVVLAGCLIFLGGLVLFAWAGVFTRYWADDYCYSAVAGQHGLWGGLVEWYRYSGNRFSAIVSVAVLDRMGPLNVAFLPTILLALWVYAWVFFLARLFRYLFGWRPIALWLALFGLAQVFFTALLAPDRLQTIYWRMGVLHYALPLPLLLIVLGWTVEHICRPGRPWMLLASAGMAFFAAGQSETYAMLQVGVLGLGLLAALALARGAQRRRAALWVGVPLLSTLAVILLMFLSPSLSFRLSVMPAPTNLWLVVPYTLRYTADFVFYSLRGQIVPYAVYGLTAAALALVVFRLPGFRPPSLRASLLGAILSLVVTFVLIACSFTPSAYANLQYPAGRALMPASFTLLAGLASLAFFCAAAARVLLPSPARPELLRGGLLPGILVPLLLAVLSLYPLRAARAPLEDLRQLSAWAARWDARDAQIRQASAEGELDLVVQEVEVVRTLEDLGPNSSHWVNNCAAMYYGVRSITANP